MSSSASKVTSKGCDGVVEFSATLTAMARHRAPNWRSRLLTPASDVYDTTAKIQSIYIIYIIRMTHTGVWWTFVLGGHVINF